MSIKNMIIAFIAILAISCTTIGMSYSNKKKVIDSFDKELTALREVKSTQIFEKDYNGFHNYQTKFMVIETMKIVQYEHENQIINNYYVPDKEILIEMVQIMKEIVKSKPLFDFLFNIEKTIKSSKTESLVFINEMVKEKISPYHWHDMYLNRHCKIN